MIDELVATVRLRERFGAAIGVCESPPLLEIGPSAADVISRLKERLLAHIVPSEGASQHVLIYRDGEAVTESLR